MTPDLESFANEIGALIARIARTDLALLRGYSQDKARAIAGFSLLVGDAYARGEIDAEQMKMEMQELDRMVLRFVRNITALAATMAERVISGVRALVLGTLARLAGVQGLMLPDFRPAA